MATDYNKVGQNPRINYRNIFTPYSDKTHFVYELVQNADDNKSHCIELQLHENELIVWNDGCEFTESDVRSICSIGFSNKDLTQIGTFGMGFKAVYAYTDNPEVYSGDEHFRISINNPTKPEGIDTEDIDVRVLGQLDKGKTVFCLPFRNNLRQEEEIARLRDRLYNLEKRALLFLRNLKRVRWCDESREHVGSYSCHRRPHDRIQDASKVELRASINGKDQPSEKFLIFRKEVQPPQAVVDELLEHAENDDERRRIQRSAKKLQPIEVAFKLQNGKITAMNRCVLFSYFPTQKETHLKFLIQASYKTTLARDNIETDNRWNEWLIQKTADFLPEILEKLKKVGLLEPLFFNIVPLKEDNVPSEFSPINEALQKSMQEKSLVPTQDGMYAKAGTVFYPHRESLRELIESSWLYPNSNWLHSDIGDTEEFRRCFKVMREAGVKEIGISQVLDWLEKRDSDWFEGRCEEWLRSLYVYLSSQKAELDRIRKLPLVRLENGQHMCASEAFFPPDTVEEREEIAPFLNELPILQSGLLEGDERNNIEGLLKDLGSLALNPADLIHKWIIPQYSQSDDPSKGENFSHVRYLFKVWDKLSENQRRDLTREISEIPILWAYNGIQPETFNCVKPCEAYLAEAYTGDRDLETYFSVSDGEYWFVDNGYLEGTSNSKEWFKFLKAIGVMDTPLVTDQKIEPDAGNDQKFREELAKRNIKPEHPTRWREKSITDRYLHCLPEILNKISKDNEANLARCIWQLLVKMVNPLPSELGRRDNLFKNHFQGIYWWFRWSDQEKFFDATFYRQLKETAWLPDEKGKFHRPSKCFAPTDDNRKVLGDSVAYLHSDFDISPDNEAARWLAGKLGIYLNANTNSVLNYLQTLSDTEVGVEQVLPLYRFLEDQSARREVEFKAESLIFISIPGPRWWKSNEVFWEDESAVFGNRRGYLKENYADYETTLKPFFIALGVSERASPSDYVRVIREVASVERANDEGVRERIKILYRRLWQILQEGGSLLESEEWQKEWERTRAGKYWLGKEGNEWNFFFLHKLVWKDDNYRSRLFKSKSKIPFWAFDNDLLELAKCLDVKGCYEDSGVEFNYYGDQGEDQIWLEKVRNLHPYIYDFLNSPRLGERYREEPSAEILERLSVRRAQRLEVSYRLNGVSVPDPDPRQSFLDQERDILWLGLEEDEEAYPDLIGDALQDTFRIDQLREFVKDLLPAANLSKAALLSWERRGFQPGHCLSPPELKSKEGDENASESVDERFRVETGSEDGSEVNESKVETSMVNRNPEVGNEDVNSGPTGTNQSGGHWKNTHDRRNGSGGHGGRGGGGEGEKHRILKEDIADNSSQFGTGLKLVKIEFRFQSGDKVDILLEDSCGKPVTVEVETHIPHGNYVGVWQAVKYKHLAAVEYNLPCEQVRSILAAPEIPDDVKDECKKLGIEPFEVPD